MLGEKSAEASTVRKGSRIYGRNAATVVHEIVATPGVFWNVSITSPKKKPHKYNFHLAIPRGSSIRKYIYNKGVAQPKSCT